MDYIAVGLNVLNGIVHGVVLYAVTKLWLDYRARCRAKRDVVSHGQHVANEAFKKYMAMRRYMSSPHPQKRR